MYYVFLFILLLFPQLSYAVCFMLLPFEKDKRQI